MLLMSLSEKLILFLGYDEKETCIIDALKKNNYIVYQTRNKFLFKNYDLVICFGYKKILSKETIQKLNCPIINLHISYLPYNRGAHPNFWSFYENTPSGVTIHLIDEGIDTGPIIIQKYVFFNNDHDTFKKTYDVLINEIEKLFIDNLELILNKQWILKKQSGEGSHHYLSDLPTNFSGWNSNINFEISRLRLEGFKYD